MRCGAALGSTVAAATAEESSEESRAGTELGPYRLDALVGRGSFSEVYRATSRERGTVAVKVLRCDAKARERFLAESLAMGRLDHPNVVPILDVGEADGLGYFVMPFYEGGTLRDRIERAMPLGDAVRIAASLASALGAAHEAGIIHRDLKPENVLFDEAGIARLSDFGLARLAEDPRLDDITDDRATLGTLPYVAPEHLRHEQVDPRADLWALGVILYEVISGQKPFMSSEQGAVRSMIEGKLPALRAVRPDVPPRLSRLVSRLVTPDPNRREGSAEAVEAELRSIAVEDLPDTPVSGDEAPRSRARKSSVPVAAMLVADRYRLESEIGRGGMGSVWRADHLGLRVPCAVKLLRPELDAAAYAQQRFLDEAHMLARLDHPNIVHVYDAGLHRGRPFIAMELLEGETLKALLDRRGHLRPEEALEILKPVAEALARAHEVGVIHRDLKPENVFVSATPKGQRVPKILDFGISRITTATAEASTTAQGVIVGTPVYMSPEQIEGKGADASADVWALAVVAYRMLTASLPFLGDSLPALALRISTGRAVPPSRLRKELPPALDAVFTQAFDPDPRRRPPNAVAVVAAIERACATAPAAPIPSASSAPARRRVPVTGLVFFGAAVAVALTIRGLAAPDERRGAEPRRVAPVAEGPSTRSFPPDGEAPRPTAAPRDSTIEAVSIDSAGSAPSSPRATASSTARGRAGPGTGGPSTAAPGGSAGHPPAASGTGPSMFDRRD